MKLKEEIKRIIENSGYHVYIDADGCADEIVSLFEKQMIKNIGQLRQWLNENRITDPKKMVDNEELEMFLLDKLVKEKR